MNKTLKYMFHQHINKQSIYDQILNQNIKKRKMKYAIISLCVIFIFAFGFLHQQVNVVNTFSVYAYNEEGTKQDLKINSEILLNQYNKLQSNVPGYPIKITLNKNNQYDKIKLTVDNGHILTWNQENGIVKDHGKSYILTHTEIIYLDIHSKATAQLLAMEGNKTIVSQLLKFTCDSQYHLKGKSYTPNIFIE